jgi:hypothetical protein
MQYAVGSMLRFKRDHLLQTAYCLLPTAYFIGE